MDATGSKEDNSEDPELVTIRLLGGPYDGQQLTFGDTPTFLGIGDPIHRYEAVPSDGEALFYRFVEP